MSAYFSVFKYSGLTRYARFIFCLVFPLSTANLWLFFLSRKVRKAEGLRLSSEFESLFAEVSAADGRNVENNLLEMAKLLREKQDRDIERAMAAAVSLHQKHQNRAKKKKTCC